MQLTYDKSSEREGYRERERGIHTRTRMPTLVRAHARAHARTLTRVLAVTLALAQLPLLWSVPNSRARILLLMILVLVLLLGNGLLGGLWTKCTFFKKKCSCLGPKSCNLRHYVNTWSTTCHNKPRKLHGFGGTGDTGDRTWDLVHQRVDPHQLSFRLGFWIHSCHGATFVSVWLPDPHLYSNSSTRRITKIALKMSSQTPGNKVP